MEHKIEYEVTKKTTNAKEAFEIISTFTQPVCVIVFGDNGTIGRPAYQDVTDRIKRVIPIIYEGNAPWAATEMLHNGKNVILEVRSPYISEPGNLHRTISGIASGSKCSIIGVCVKCHSSSADSVTHSAHQRNRLSDCLDCLIVVG